MYLDLGIASCSRCSTERRVYRDLDAMSESCGPCAVSSFRQRRNDAWDLVCDFEQETEKEKQRREAARIRERNRRNKRRALGLCVQCGNKNTGPSTRCEPCREKNSAYQKKFRRT